MWMENPALFLSGRPVPRQRCERRKQRRQTETGRRRVGTRERETQEGTEEKASTIKIMRRKREGQGQPEAAFPPRSLSGSGVTRKLARLHTLHPPPPPSAAFL